MKKIKFILGLALMASAFFSSCTDDTTAVGPSLIITTDNPVLTEGNETIIIKWRADAGDAKLDLFTVKQGNVTIVDMNNVDWNNFEIANADNDTYIDSAVVIIGDESTSFTLTVTDKDAISESVTVTVTVDQGSTAGEIDSYTAILMGAQSSSVGSFLDANSGNVFLQSPAESSSSLIDVVYYFGTTNLATLAAPNDVTVNGGAGNLSYCVDFTTKNATKFGTSAVTPTEFAAMTNDTDIATITGLTDTKLTGLTVGDVLEFETAGGKKGLIHVSALTAVNTGTITLNVKIQK